jgi:pyrimidine deaminase RibD-like protein/NTP pyrophosphatase (non-canonical NTP hydrolase)
MDASEIEFCRLAVDEAKRSKPEDNRPHPRVGVVVVKDGKVIATAHRGEHPGEHAEYIALERKLKDGSIAGATVYTTLEPCTVRKQPKIPCATRLAERKVGKVVIGTLDPNPLISGKGQLSLRERNVVTELFPEDLMREIEEINREFSRSFRVLPLQSDVSKEFIEANRKRELDRWYEVINSIYWNGNFYRGATSIFSHLVEVIGGLSSLASEKEKRWVVPQEFVAKAIAWWLALCGKAGIRSVSDLLWTKFPWVCPYCLKCPHSSEECVERKAKLEGPDWQSLGIIGDKDRTRRPHSLGEWQRMFAIIYPVQQTEDFGASFARLAEELGELAEALRIFSAVPGYFLSEAADVFAWLMHIQNLIEFKKKVSKEDRGRLIEVAFCQAYPDRCRNCGTRTCKCPPILSSTVGRIGHEVPTISGTFDFGRNFMTSDEAVLRFQLGADS